MVIATTIEQEKQRNQMFKKVMEELRHRVHDEVRRVVHNKQYAYANTTKKRSDLCDLYKFDKPYFTLDVPALRCFRFNFESCMSDTWEFDEETEVGMRLNFSLLNVKRGKCERGTTNRAAYDATHQGRKVTTKYVIQELKEMCKMNAIKVPSAAKYNDIVALLKTLP